MNIDKLTSNLQKCILILKYMIQNIFNACQGKFRVFKQI